MAVASRRKVARAWLARSAWQAALLAALLGGASPAGAQQAPAAASLEELLRQSPTDVPRDVEESTSSRFAQSASQAPSVTYVLTDSDIARFGLRNVADILRCMPGLYVTNDVNFTYVGARGIGRPGDYNARLLFLVDGMRTNENIYDSGMLGPESFVDVELIDRVEYAPGPGSSLYGNSAFFGVINIITKGADKLQGLQIQASADSVRQRQMRASWGRRAENGVEGWMAMSAFNQDRIEQKFKLPAEDLARIADRSWDRGGRLLGMVSGGGWTLRGGISRRERGDFAYLKTTDSAQFGQQRGIDEHNFISLAHERALGKDWTLYGAVSLKRSAYRDIGPYLREGGAQYDYVDLSQGRWMNLDLRVSTHRWRDHDLMAGIEYQKDIQQLLTSGTVGEQPDAEFWGENRRYGLFVQDAWKLNDTQRLILGLRRDQAMVGGGSTNPRLAWIWSGVTDATLKLMFGSAFREANLYEYRVNADADYIAQLYQLPGVATPSPERVHTLELAWEHSLDRNLQYRVSVYGSQLRDLISIDKHTGAFENSGLIRSVGLELGLERRWSHGEQLRASLSWQTSKDDQGQGLDNSPHVLGKLMFSQPLRGDALQLSWQALSESKRSTNGHTLPGYVLLNTSLLWRPSLNTDVVIGLYNALDARYYDRPRGIGPALRQEGRVFRLSIARRFGS